MRLPRRFAPRSDCWFLKIYTPRLAAGSFIDIKSCQKSLRLNGAVRGIMGGEIIPNLRYSAVCCMGVHLRLVRVTANDGPPDFQRIDRAHEDAEDKKPIIDLSSKDGFLFESPVTLEDQGYDSYPTGSFVKPHSRMIRYNAMGHEIPMTQTKGIHVNLFA